MLNDIYGGSFGTILRETHQRVFYTLFKLWRKGKFRPDEPSEKENEKEKVFEKCKGLRETTDRKQNKKVNEK
jgi:hypothetical protein